MKTLIFVFGIFFLNACVSNETTSALKECPPGFVWEKTFVLEYEYGSAQMNENAQDILVKVAQKVRTDNSSVCFVGTIGRRGLAQDNLRLALARAQNAADVFLKVGVGFEKIYISVEPQAGKIGFSVPVKATDEKHRLAVLTGK